MTTLDEHARAVAALVRSASDGLGRRELPSDARSVARHPRRYLARVLAADVLAAADVPGFDNSQMDGFAVRSADLTEPPTSLAVAAPVPAGEPAPPLEPGTTAPVMTGSPIPAGADAVVPVERTGDGRFDVERARFEASAAPGAYVRRRGVDAMAGDVLATEGSPLRLAHLGAFAAAGVPHIAVRRRLRALVVTNGNELRSDPGALAPGQIPDAIGGMLVAAVVASGARARLQMLAADDPARLVALLDAEAGSSDIVITVGGVSKGAYEVVRSALEPRGVEFGHVAMQPGGPQGLGRTATAGGERAVVCLPGNPVSALLSFEVFLRPVLRELAGLRPIRRTVVTAPLSEPIESAAHQHQVRRGVLADDGRVAPIGGPGSHLIAHYGAADALIHVPVGVTRLDVGDEVEVWRIDD